MEFYSCIFGFIAGVLAGIVLTVSSYIDKAKSGKDFTYTDSEIKWVERKEKDRNAYPDRGADVKSPIDVIELSMKAHEELLTELMGTINKED